MDSSNLIQIKELLLLPQEEETQLELHQVKLFKGQVILNPTISKLNFFTYLLFSVYLGVVILPISLLQVPLYSVVYELTSSEQDTLNSASQLSQLVMRFLAASWIGYLCDRLGRKPFIIAGIILIGVGTAFLPNIPSVYPYYILVQLLLEVGFLCLAIPPLLADYIDYETKGRVAGIGTLIMNVTYFCMTFIEAEDDNIEANIVLKFYEFGGIAFAIGVVLMLGLKGGKYHKNLLVDKKAEEAKRNLLQGERKEFPEESSTMSLFKESTEDTSYKDSSLENFEADSERQIEKQFSLKKDFSNNSDKIIVEDKQLSMNTLSNAQDKQTRPSYPQTIMMIRKKEQKPGFITGLKEARNPWILIGFICDLLGMADISMLGFIFVSYVVHLEGNSSAAKQAYFLANKRLIVGIIASLFFGFCSDKYNKFKQILFVILSSIIAVILLILAPNPYHVMTYISMACFGIATAGYFTFGKQLISKYPNPKYRASVNAVAGLAGALGSSTVGILGLYLRQYTGIYLLPFYIYLGWAVIGLIFLIVLYITKKDILNKL